MLKMFHFVSEFLSLFKVYVVILVMTCHLIKFGLPTPFVCMLDGTEG